MCAITEGTRVRLTDPPGTKVPYGAVGVAEEAPGAGGLFWATFPQGRMHTRRSEVKIVQEPTGSGSAWKADKKDLEDWS